MARRAQGRGLPCAYFHITITVPEELRDALRSNQKDCYTLLMKASAEAIIELARDPRYVGATVGILAVLHTWTQQLLYHPHVHKQSTDDWLRVTAWMDDVATEIDDLETLGTGDPRRELREVR